MCFQLIENFFNCMFLGFYIIFISNNTIIDYYFILNLPYLPILYDDVFQIVILNF